MGLGRIPGGGCRALSWLILDAKLSRGCYVFRGIGATLFTLDLIQFQHRIDDGDGNELQRPDSRGAIGEHAEDYSGIDYHFIKFEYDQGKEAGDLRAGGERLVADEFERNDPGVYRRGDRERFD